MSKYSELMGSFIRTGNFPIEADYIFETEEELKEFYSNPLNKTILHLGLFKIVRKDPDGNQALYWVINSNNDYQFVKLITSTSLTDLETKISDLNAKLIEEIANRKEIIDGSIDRLPEDLNNLMKITAAINSLLTDANNFKDVLKNLVGTDQDDIIEYLKTLPITNLTDLINTVQSLLDNNINSQEFLEELQAEMRYALSNVWDELNKTQAGVGLDSSGLYSPDQETNYLKNATSVMNALRILDSLIYKMAQVNVYTSKGSVDNLEELKALPSVSNGYVYNVESEITLNGIQYPAYTNFVYIGLEDNQASVETNWDSLGGMISTITVKNSNTSPVILSLTKEQELSANLQIDTDPSNVLTVNEGKLSVIVTTDDVSQDGESLRVILEQLDWYEGE